MNEVRIVGNDIIISVDEVVANMENAALIEDNKRLQAESAELRELVRIMHGELVSCEDNGYVCGGHKFDERVRELGIEVDA